MEKNIDSYVTLRSDERWDVYPLLLVADGLGVPIDRFYDTKKGLRNVFFDGSESDMYWAMKVVGAELPTLKVLIAKELNEAIYKKSRGKLESFLRCWAPQLGRLTFDEQELVLSASLFTRAWMIQEPAREPYVENGILHIEELRFSWPVQMIRDAGFDYWWRNTIGDSHGLNKDEIYAIAYKK